MPLKEQWNSAAGTEVSMKESVWPGRETAPVYADTLYLSFSSYQSGVAQGEVTSFYFQKSRLFQGLDQLVFAIDEFLDEAGEHKPEYQYRKLDSEGGKARFGEPASGWNSPSPQTGGKLCSACLRIYFRQHASLQGELRVSGHPAVHFRSALELMYLLRDALASAAACKY